jgi:large subunit ribosomal protein L31
MKTDIHPKNYRQVIFLDTSSGEKFLLYSTIETAETDKWEDGKEYPLAKVEISSASHPFYTGKETTIDTAGRVERFKARQKAATGDVKSKKDKKAEKRAQKEKAETKKEKKEDKK